MAKLHLSWTSFRHWGLRLWSGMFRFCTICQLPFKSVRMERHQFDICGPFSKLRHFRSTHETPPIGYYPNWNHSGSDACCGNGTQAKRFKVDFRHCHTSNVDHWRKRWKWNQWPIWFESKYHGRSKWRRKYRTFSNDDDEAIKKGQNQIRDSNHDQSRIGLTNDIDVVGIQAKHETKRVLSRIRKIDKVGLCGWKCGE